MPGFYERGGGPRGGAYALAPLITDHTVFPYPYPPQTAQVFHAVEIQTYSPPFPINNFARGRGSHPRGAVLSSPVAIEDYRLLRVSDTGYISHPSDIIGQVIYPSLFSDGWSIERQVRLEPWTYGAAYSWGQIKLITNDGRYDETIITGNCDGRLVKVYRGTKLFEEERGIHLNPSYATLIPIFSGVGKGIWRKNENVLEIDIRDASYQSERPVQETLYDGSGGYGGSANIRGKPLPFCRGGTSSYPILNVSPVLIDTLNRIYQYNDAPGTIVHLYENSGEVFTYAGDTTNLYAGGVASGSYRTDNSRGLFQLGVVAQGEITADVTGSFPGAGLKSTAVAIAQYILSETMSIDASYLDTGSFLGLNGARPWIAGIYITDPTDAIDIVGQLVRSVNGVVIPGNDGKLKAIQYRAPETLPVSAIYTENQIISCTPAKMPDTLSPPPFRIRVGHSRRYTTQTDNWAGAASQNRIQLVSEPWSYEYWSGAENLLKYRTKNDPPLVESLLLNSVEANELVNDFGAIFGERRELYNLELPMYLCGRHEIGAEILVSFPGTIFGEDGRNAVVVGNRIVSNNPTFTLMVIT